MWTQSPGRNRHRSASHISSCKGRRLNPGTTEAIARVITAASHGQRGGPDFRLRLGGRGEEGREGQDQTRPRPGRPGAARLAGAPGMTFRIHVPAYDRLPAAAASPARLSQPCPHRPPCDEPRPAHVQASRRGGAGHRTRAKGSRSRRAGRVRAAGAARIGLAGAWNARGRQPMRRWRNAQSQFYMHQRLSCRTYPPLATRITNHHRDYWWDASGERVACRLPNGGG